MKKTVSEAHQKIRGHHRDLEESLGELHLRIEMGVNEARLRIAVPLAEAERLLRGANRALELGVRPLRLARDYPRVTIAIAGAAAVGAALLIAPSRSQK